MEEADAKLAVFSHSQAYIAIKLVILFQVMRGMAKASNRNNYEIIFSVFGPHLPAFVNLLQVYIDYPEVSVKNQLLVAFVLMVMLNAELFSLYCETVLNERTHRTDLTTKFQPFYTAILSFMFPQVSVFVLKFFIDMVQSLSGILDGANRGQKKQEKNGCF